MISIFRSHTELDVAALLSSTLVWDDQYLAHALLLSKAMRIRLGDQLSHADIEIAENLLRLFWRLTEKFYG